MSGIKFSLKQLGKNETEKINSISVFNLLSIYKQNM